MKLLLDQGASVNRSAKEFTPVVWAAKHSDTPMVKLLIEHDKASVNSTSNGLTAMMYAAKSGAKGVMQVLREGGASVNAKGQLGQTPLMLAAKAGDLNALQYLVQHRADLEAADDDGRTATSYASNRAILQFLSWKGAALPYNSSASLLQAADEGNVEKVKAIFHQQRLSRMSSASILKFDI